MQTQTLNTLHNAIMEAGSKDCPPMLAPGNYIQWKSIIKRYIDAKLNHELIHHCLKNPPYKFTWADKEIPISEGSPVTRTESQMETYKTILQDIRDQLNAEAEAVQIILTGIDNDIYSTVDACPNACEMWKAIERLKQGESINVQDLETNLYWEFRKFTSQDGESLESYYLRFYKMMNELIRNQCDVTNHQVNVQFLLQLQPEWKRSQQAATRNREKAIVNSPPPIYDHEPSMVTEDDEMSKDKEIDKLMALISLSFKKIYKPTNNNLRTSSNTNRANQDNSLRINRNAGYENQRIGNVAGARETVGSTVQEEARIQLNADQADWRDDTDDDELEDQELEAHYMYMAKLQEVSPDAADSGPIFDAEPLQKIDHNNDDADLVNERELLASLIEKLKCEIDESKNRNKFLETSNKKEAQIKLYKTREDQELDKVIALENKVKVLDNIVYKTGQSVQTMNMLNNKCRTSFAKPEFLKKAQRMNPRLYDIGVISTTSVSRPQLKSNPIGDRVMHNNSQGKKQDVEDHCRNVKFSKNNTFVTACNDSLKAKTLNVNFVCATCGKCVLKEKHDMCVLKSINGVKSRTKMPIDVPVSTRELKCTVKQSVAKHIRKTVDSESNQKPRNITRKLYERVRKECNWWYPRSTPPGYKWKPKSRKENVNPNVSMPLGSVSRTSNILEHTTSRKCVLNDNHDMCVLHYINGVNSRTKIPMVVPISTREPKRTMNQSAATPLKRTVAVKSTNQKPRSAIRKQYEKIIKTCKW
nr:hypothetical protein [Tanacetum cinerariifolium]